MSLVDRQELLDHYKNPRNSGKPEKFDVSCKLKNKSCGDDITVFITFAPANVSDPTRKITSINYEIRGCGLSIASASMLSQELSGLSEAEVMDFDSEQLEELVGQLTMTRSKCAHLPLEAIKQALTAS